MAPWWERPLVPITIPCPDCGTTIEVDEPCATCEAKRGGEQPRQGQEVKSR